jgi:hypothetical protein
MAGNSSPSWMDAPELWDSVKIAGTTFPCMEPPTFKLARHVEKKTTPGTDGSTITDKGKKAAEVSISLTLWESKHWKALASLVALVKPKLPKTEKVDPVATDPRFFVRTPYGPGFEDALFQELTVTQPSLAQTQPVVTSSNARVEASRAKVAREKALAPVSVFHPALAAYGIATLHIEELSSPRRVKPGVYEVVLKGTQFLTQRGSGTTTPKTGAADTSLSRIRLAPELEEQTQRQRPSATDRKP